jgi:hypothetical protein
MGSFFLAPEKVAAASMDSILRQLRGEGKSFFLKLKGANYEQNVILFLKNYQIKIELIKVVEPPLILMKIYNNNQHQHTTQKNK